MQATGCSGPCLELREHAVSGFCWVMRHVCMSDAHPGQADEARKKRDGLVTTLLSQVRWEVLRFGDNLLLCFCGSSHRHFPPC